MTAPSKQFEKQIQRERHQGDRGWKKNYKVSLDARLLTSGNRKRMISIGLKGVFLANGLHSSPALNLRLFQGAYHITSTESSETSVPFQKSANIPILQLWEPSAHLLPLGNRMGFFRSKWSSPNKRRKHYRRKVITHQAETSYANNVSVGSSH